MGRIFKKIQMLSARSIRLGLRNPTRLKEKSIYCGDNSLETAASVTKKTFDIPLWDLSNQIFRSVACANFSHFSIIIPVFKTQRRTSRRV